MNVCLCDGGKWVAPHIRISGHSNADKPVIVIENTPPSEQTSSLWMLATSLSEWATPSLDQAYPMSLRSEIHSASTLMPCVSMTMAGRFRDNRMCTAQNKCFGALGIDLDEIGLKVFGRCRVDT